jgi:DTW domain-containing protein YfiP
MRAGDCLCALIVPLATRTRFSLVLHRKELGKPSNTGRLGHLALINSEVLVHGARDAGRVSLGPLDAAYGGRYLLFPANDARPLEELAGLDRPLHLVVPDGTWGQAQRMVRRIPDLASLPRVSIAPRQPSRYVLRRNQLPGNVCTLEAVVAACALLESAEVAAALQGLLRVMIERSLAWKSPERRQLYAQLQQGS